MRERSNKTLISRSIRSRAALLAVVLAFGCSEGNPILGRWAVDPQLSPPGSAVGLETSGSAEIAFEETRMVAGADALEVTYTVEGDRVIVTTQQGQTTTYEFEPEIRDRMSVRTPLGPIVFRRLP